MLPPEPAPRTASISTASLIAHQPYLDVDKQLSTTGKNRRVLDLSAQPGLPVLLSREEVAPTLTEVHLIFIETESILLKLYVLPRNICIL